MSPGSERDPRAGLRAWAADHVALVVSGGLALIALAPLLAPGYVLSYDMVFVPELSFSRDLLGLGTSVPRAVPSDLLVAAWSHFVPGDLVQKLILGGILVGGGVGAARSLDWAPQVARVGAAALYVWNPFVYERLVMGHWSLLVSYAALPWVVHGALALRDRVPNAGWSTAGALAFASFGNPAGGIIACGTALLVACAPWRDRRTSYGPFRARAAAMILAASLVLNAPWLVPSVLQPGGVPAPAVGAEAFAASADSPLGTVGSLMTMGGIWNRLAVPVSRASWLQVPAWALVLVVAAGGWAAIGRSWGRGATAGMLAAAALGLLVAVAPSLPILRSVFASVVTELPGGGLVRDSQKFVMPLVLVEAMGFGAGLERLGRGLASRRVGLTILALTVGVPVALLPDLAWGAWGRLGTARYPREWEQARARMSEDPAPGGLLVVPWHLYMAYPWNENRVVLSPAQRYFDRRAVVNDDLELVGLTVPGEDPWARMVAPLVKSAAPLAAGLQRHGIRYVLVLKVEDWRGYLSRLQGLDRVVGGDQSVLYRGRPSRIPRFVTTPAGPVVAADLVALLLVLWIGWRLLLVRRQPRNASLGAKETGGR